MPPAATSAPADPYAAIRALVVMWLGFPARRPGTPHGTLLRGVEVGVPDQLPGLGQRHEHRDPGRVTGLERLAVDRLDDRHLERDHQDVGLSRGPQAAHR